jgi:hypothetical protein
MLSDMEVCNEKNKEDTNTKTISSQYHHDIGSPAITVAVNTTIASRNPRPTSGCLTVSN